MNYTEDRAIIKFRDEMNCYLEQAMKDFKHYIENPSKNLHKCLLDKYPYWKRDSNRLTKRKKTILSKPFIHEILQFKRDNESVFTDEEKTMICKYNIKKLCGIYKHAQALKTGYCNLKIINGFSIPNFISVCITKNSLEANEQWLERLYKELDNRYPQIKLNDKIMIISSRKNTLNGNATHCKDMKDAWTLLKRTNNFNIIFVCSNSIRIHDILDMLLDFQNLTLPLQKKIQILHDEAHNPKEGIPPNRDIVENIVLQSNVICYIPITATNKLLFVEDNPIWQESNLENEALDYTTFDKTTSMDPHYSSCSDSKIIRFEEMKKMTGWKNYEIKQIPFDIFDYIHGEEYSKYKKYTTKQLQDELQNEIDFVDQPMVDIDIFSLSNDDLVEKIIAMNSERRRTLEFCPFMKNDKEIEAINNGLNILHINEIMQTDIIIPGKFEIYIISTPNRRILTAYLAAEAAKLSYKPIVLGIYGNEGDKYNLYCDEEILEVSEIMDTGEFNCKLEKLFAWMKTEGKNINRPFIIIGNYVPTGESLTFVNYTYGAVRCNIKLISTSAEEDYQESARSNYMDTKFIEKDPNWTQPEKFLIGPSAYIENALSYEAENDARINSFISNVSLDDRVLVIRPSHIEPTIITGGIVAIPVKITVDWSHTETKKLVAIAEKSRRSPEDKVAFLSILKSMVEDEESGCEFTDKSGKFDFSKFKLKDFRSYKKKEGGPKSGEWKFMSYKNHHEIKTPFINDKNNIDINECEILTCIDTYLLKDDSGHFEKNPKYTWWMGYKYDHIRHTSE